MGEIFNEAKFSFKTKEDRLKAIAAINYYFQKPILAAQEIIKAGIREFTTSSDFPSSVLYPIIQKFRVSAKEIDIGYQTFFDYQDQGIKGRGFTLRKVTSGLQFREVLPGQKVQIDEVSGDDVYVKYKRYSAAIGVFQEDVEDEEYSEIQDEIAAFRERYFWDMAIVAYTLLEAIPNNAAHNVPYDTTTGANQLTKDIRTINATATELMVAANNGGVPVTVGTPLGMLVHSNDFVRVDTALKATSSTVTAGESVKFNIKPVYTPNKQSADNWIMGIPKGMLKFKVRKQLESYTSFDPELYAHTVYGHSRFAGLIGNTYQLRRMSKS